MSIQSPLKIEQSVAVLIDGNNIEISIHQLSGDKNAMLNFDTLIPKLLDQRALNRLIYFREGKSISTKLAERLHDHYHGSVVACHKSADIPLTIKATQLSRKVDTIIILSGDSDYIELVRHLKNEGVRVEIAAIEQTTARILLEEADHFHSIGKEDWFVYNPHPQSHSHTSATRPLKPSKTPAMTSKTKEKSETSQSHPRPIRHQTKRTPH
jgi:hypothetical protein